jgi:hypothetical protein
MWNFKKALTAEDIVEELSQIYDILDLIQESSIAQTNPELMEELGESMGHVDNAIDILDVED